MTDHIQSLNLGLKLKQLRKSHQCSLEEFAQKVHLSVELLRRMEKNEVAAPIATLINIADKAGCDLDYFLSSSNKDRSYSFCPKGRARAFHRDYPAGKNPLSYSFKQLAPFKKFKHMEPLMVEFTPGKEKVPQVAHEGEEFLYLLTGRLEARIKRSRILLSSGDSLYFDSKDPHAFRALGKKKAQAIVVLYPY